MTSAILIAVLYQLSYQLGQLGFGHFVNLCHTRRREVMEVEYMKYIQYIKWH